MPRVDRRRHWTSWNWSCTCLWVFKWVPGIESRFSRRPASALSCWATYVAPHFDLFFHLLKPASSTEMEQQSVFLRADKLNTSPCCHHTPRPCDSSQAWPFWVKDSNNHSLCIFSLLIMTIRKWQLIKGSIIKAGDRQSKSRLLTQPISKRVINIMVSKLISLWI